MVDVGRRIRELREDRRMSQTELANRVEVTQNTVSRIETGATTPSLKFLENLASVLEVGMADFFPRGRRPPLEQGQVYTDRLERLELGGVERNERSDVFWSNLWVRAELGVEAAVSLLEEYRDDPTGFSSVVDVLRRLDSLRVRALSRYLNLHGLSLRDLESHEPIEEAPRTEREIAEVFAWKPR